MAYEIRKMRLTVHDIRGAIHIAWFADAHPAAGAPVFTDAWQAGAFIRRHFHDACTISRLRGALAGELHGLARLDDAEIVRQAALRLVRGAWRLSLDIDAAPTPRSNAGLRAAVARGHSEPAPAAPRPSGAPVTPGAARGAGPASTPAANAAAPLVAEQEWTAATDQVVQARTLEQAARLGAPFCAICAARARAREEAQARQDAKARQDAEAGEAAP